MQAGTQLFSVCYFSRSWSNMGLVNLSLLIDSYLLDVTTTKGFYPTTELLKHTTIAIEISVDFIIQSLLFITYFIFFICPHSLHYKASTCNQGIFKVNFNPSNLGIKINKRQTITMIPLLRNRPEYQIQMDQSGPYPFNGVIPDKFFASVKLTISFSSAENDLHEGVKKTLSLEHQCFIKITKVTESHLKKSYTIIYQYVPFKFNHPSTQFHDYLKTGKYKNSLLEMFTEMLQNGIKPTIKFQNFGYDPDFKIRMFVRPNCQSYLCDPNTIQKTAYFYLSQWEKIFLNLQPNEKFKLKVTNLSEKLKKIQNQILNKEFRKKQKKQSESIKNSSENSDSIAKTGSNQKIGNAQWHFDHDFHFEDSYSVRDPKVNKKKRSSSFKQDEKPKSENKHKKASWEASCKQQKSSFVESDKITVLKRRISEALLKTQKTLTKYEKIKNRGEKRKGNA